MTAVPAGPPPRTTRCRWCGHRLYERTGSGRYRWTDCPDGTDTLGSGSECPTRAAGHEPEPVTASTAPGD